MVLDFMMHLLLSMVSIIGFSNLFSGYSRRPSPGGLPCRFFGCDSRLCGVVAVNELERPLPGLNFFFVAWFGCGIGRSPKNFKGAGYQGGFQIDTLHIFIIGWGDVGWGRTGVEVIKS